MPVPAIVRRLVFVGWRRPIDQLAHAPMAIASRTLHLQRAIPARSCERPGQAGVIVIAGMVEQSLVRLALALVKRLISWRVGHYRFLCDNDQRGGTCSQ